MVQRSNWILKTVNFQTSIDIQNLLELDNNRNTCNIELRAQRGSFLGLEVFWKPVQW